MHNDDTWMESNFFEDIFYKRKTSVKKHPGWSSYNGNISDDALYQEYIDKIKQTLTSNNTIPTTVHIDPKHLKVSISETDLGPDVYQKVVKILGE
jgi:hypothetical protein